MVANSSYVEFQDFILDEIMEGVKIGKYFSRHIQFATSCMWKR